MPNLNVGLFAAIVVGALGCASSNVFAAAFVSGTGWARPCQQTGYDSELGGKCTTWCQQSYGTTYAGSAMSVGSCASVGITNTSFKMCCMNRAAQDIIRDCKCADPNQLTVKDRTSNDTGNNKAYTITYSNSDYPDLEVATLTCHNLYCFCDREYYGERKKIGQTASGDCKKCPCEPGTYSTSNGSQLCGWTTNNFINLVEDANAPSTTLASCKLGPVSSGSPIAYRTYDDLKGRFTMDTYCPHSGIELCDNVSHKCSNNSTTQYTLGTPSDTAGAGCWCHANNKYVFIGTMGVASGCAAGCPTSCKNVVSSNPTVRTLLGCDG